jgi:formylmethanofuran dehydrogenase subunit E
MTTIQKLLKNRTYSLFVDVQANNLVNQVIHNITIIDDKIISQNDQLSKEEQKVVVQAIEKALIKKLRAQFKPSCARCGKPITQKEYETDASFCQKCASETIDA